MNVVRVLEDARKLIETPDKWTQGEYARDGMGREISLYESGITCLCALGALRLATKRIWDWNFKGDAVLVDAKTALRNVMIEPIPRFNDSHTHAEVLAAFDKAIATERAKQ